MDGAQLVPSEGGPHEIGWLRVPQPLPLEVDRGDEGFYVLDDTGPDQPRYVYVTDRL